MEIGKMAYTVEEIPEPLREFAAGLVKEAEELGLKFHGYGYVELFDGGNHDIAEGGAHVFVYHLPDPMSNKVKSLFARGIIRKHFTQDDDGQPHATYTVFFGELWHFVPYYC